MNGNRPERHDLQDHQQSGIHSRTSFSFSRVNPVPTFKAENICGQCYYPSRTAFLRRLICHRSVSERADAMSRLPISQRSSRGLSSLRKAAYSTHDLWSWMRSSKYCRPYRPGPEPRSVCTTLCLSPFVFPNEVDVTAGIMASDKHVKLSQR